MLAYRRHYYRYANFGRVEDIPYDLYILASDFRGAIFNRYTLIVYVRVLDVSSWNFSFSVSLVCLFMSVDFLKV